MQVRWLNKALQNLDQKAEYTAQTDPAAAKLVVQRIYDAVQILANNPAIGHPGRISGTRELVVTGTRYIIPYRVTLRPKCIEILRVFHSSRKLPKHW